MSTSVEILRGDPYLAIHIERTRRPENTRITTIEFGEGKIAVNDENTNLSRRQLLCLTLSSLGLSQQEASKVVHIGVTTIKTYKGTGCSELSLKNTGVAFPRYAFGSGLWLRSKAGQSLGLRAKQAAIVDLISLGATCERAALELGIAHSTAKTHLSHITSNNNLHGNAAIVVGALLSGEIDYYPIPGQGTQVSPPAIDILSPHVATLLPSATLEGFVDAGCFASIK